MNAYASGRQKRRKIQTEQNEEAVCLHNTGKTKLVPDNGVQKGCKKIMVLYRSSHKGSKPVKSNWVMHQYHLGNEEDEREGEYVVSKIFYQQQKQNEENDDCVAIEEVNPVANQHGPKIPKTPNLNPTRAGSSLLCDDVTDDYMLSSFITENQDTEDTKVDSCFPPSCSQYQEKVKPPECLAGESQAVDPDPTDVDDPLLCKEIFGSCAPLDGFAGGIANLTDGSGYGGSYAISDLDNLPDFQLTDLPFGSQESIFSWLDRL